MATTPAMNADNSCRLKGKQILQINSCQVLARKYENRGEKNLNPELLKVYYPKCLLSNNKFTS